MTEAHIDPTEAMDAYHSDRSHWGHSSLEVFRRSPQAAYALVYQGRRPDVAPSTQTAFDIGTSTHFIVEPNPEALCVVGPVNNKALKAWKDWEKKTRADYAEQHGEPDTRLYLKPKDANTVLEIWRAMREHPEVGPMLQRIGTDPDVVTECSIRWVDEDTGVPMKCRPDLWDRRNNIVVDLKTLAGESVRGDVLEYAWRNSGYHRQQAHYSMGVYAATGEWPEWFFLPLAKGLGHEIGFVQFDEVTRDAGLAQRQVDLQKLADVLARAQSEGPRAWIAPHTLTPQTLRLPPYALEI